VMGILKKARQNVLDCRTELVAERAPTVPSPFVKITMKFIVSGTNLKEKQVAKAIELSATKYCSASVMMGAAGVEMHHEYEIIEVE
jgi:putative redox protein